MTVLPLVFCGVLSLPTVPSPVGHWRAALDLAARSPLLYPTVGFHPHEADDVSPAMLEDLEELARRPEVVGVGEIGLDFYRNLSSEQNQRTLIDRQLEIARGVQRLPELTLARRAIARGDVDDFVLLESLRQADHLRAQRRLRGAHRLQELRPRR